MSSAGRIMRGAIRQARRLGTWRDAECLDLDHPGHFVGARDVDDGFAVHGAAIGHSRTQLLDQTAHEHLRRIRRQAAGLRSPAS